MEHVTQEYGTPCNLLTLTSAEYWTLKAFLEPAGVELRATMYSGATDVYTIQVRDALRETCTLWKDRPASWALDHANKDIAAGLWRR